MRRRRQKRERRRRRQRRQRRQMPHRGSRGSRGGEWGGERSGAAAQRRAPISCSRISMSECIRKLPPPKLHTSATRGVSAALRCLPPPPPLPPPPALRPDCSTKWAAPGNFPTRGSRSRNTSPRGSPPPPPPPAARWPATVRDERTSLRRLGAQASPGESGACTHSMSNSCRSSCASPALGGRAAGGRRAGEHLG